MNGICDIQGEAETQILKFARASSGKVQAGVARPGVIVDKENGGFVKGLRARVAGLVGIPTVELETIARALLEIGLREGGLEKETVENEELVRVGERCLIGV